MPQTKAYSPTEEQPYEAYQSPQPSPPTPSPVAPQAEQGYKFTGAPTTGLGAAAGLLDNIFRGYMKGKEQADVKRVMQTKAKTDNLQNSYNQDAKLLHQMAASGVDPNSEEYKQAVSAVNGSWGALQDWIGTHVNGDDGKKKKSKGKGPQQPETLQTLMEDLKSQDPNVKAQALFKLQQKMGPPVMWQVKQLQTPAAQADRQSRELGAQNNLTHEQAQATYDKLAGTPPEKMDDKQKQDFANARAVLFPPRQSGATRLYSLPDGTKNWFLPGEEPEGATALQTGATKPYKLANGETQWYQPGSQPTGATAIVGSTNKPKTGSFGDFLLKRSGEDYNEEDYLAARHEWAKAGHIAGAGAGSGADKNYAKWDTYYKTHYPEMDFEERDALVRHKVEGAGQQQSGSIAHDAIAEPRAFDNDVLSAAISTVRNLPQYKNMTTFDDALANIVGQGDDGYQYHQRSDLGKPDKHGKYSGDVTEEQLKGLERDLQTQIRAVMSGPKETALSPQARRTATSRMQPLFGPAAAPQRSGNPPVSPQASAAAPSAPGVSSSAPQGGSKQPKKGTVKMSAFLKANPGSTKADWEAIKPELQKQYDTKDE